MKTDNEDVFGFKEFDEEVLRNLDYEQIKEDLEKLENLSKSQKENIDKIAKILFAYNNEIKDQNIKTKNHISLFYETLKNLAKDRNEFLFLKKIFWILFLETQLLLFLLILSFYKG